MAILGWLQPGRVLLPGARPRSTVAHAERVRRGHSGGVGRRQAAI
jgi:hypothetical protein